MKLENLIVNRISQLNQISQKKMHKENLNKCDPHLENTLISHLLQGTALLFMRITKVEQIGVSVLIPLIFMSNYVAVRHNPENGGYIEKVLSYTTHTDLVLYNSENNAYNCTVCWKDENFGDLCYKLNLLALSTLDEYFNIMETLFPPLYN